MIDSSQWPANSSFIQQPIDRPLGVNHELTVINSLPPVTDQSSVVIHDRSTIYTSAPVTDHSSTVNESASSQPPAGHMWADTVLWQQQATAVFDQPSPTSLPPPSTPKHITQLLTQKTKRSRI